MCDLYHKVKLVKTSRAIAKVVQVVTGFEKEKKPRDLPVVCARTVGVPVTDQGAIVLCIVQSETVMLFLTRMLLNAYMHDMYVLLYAISI